MQTEKLNGLVVCGGRSIRMGHDKGLLTYYSKPQIYHLYEMLENICSKVFISCNFEQARKIKNEYRVLIDLQDYKNIGPIAALQTAFEKHPRNNYLAVGCDYPFISGDMLKEFLNSLDDKTLAAAFYNSEEDLYEPLIAYYSAEAGVLLKEMLRKNEHSLQYFLKTIEATKYFPHEAKVIKSIDTPEEYMNAKSALKIN